MKEISNLFNGKIQALDTMANIEWWDCGVRWAQLQDAKSSHSNDTADHIHFIIVFDIVESPEKFVLNIWLSIIQFAELVDEENNIYRPSIHLK